MAFNEVHTAELPMWKYRGKTKTAVKMTTQPKQFLLVDPLFLACGIPAASLVTAIPVELV